MSEEKKIFQYVQLKSMTAPDFWYKVAEVKLDIERLDEGRQSVSGTFSNFNSVSCLLECDGSAFNSDFKPQRNCFQASGVLLNKNTKDTFKDCDKAAILKQEGERFYDDVVSGACLNDPSRLAPFVLLSHADLKSYNFYFWFAFPSPIEPVVYEQSPAERISEAFPYDEIAKLTKNYKTEEDPKQLSFFVCNETFEIKYLKDVINPQDTKSNFKDADLSTTYFCFSDPSAHENAGWPLRNFIFLLLKLCPALHGKQIKVLSIRMDAQLALSSSLLFKVDLPTTGGLNKSDIKWTGWEKNKNGKLLPSISLMGDTMDPVKMSEHFANLNLKLMKWRLLPNLNLDIIKSQKCLLFGSGTLGCAIARNLLSWGVTNISFVDYGHVSFTNPVRQFLFTYEDAVKRKPKAATAAERIQAILPSANATGHMIQIPMPGHSVSESMRSKTEENIQLISSLIQSHDVIFLVTDSRESRWLPTLLGAFYKKIVITTALGFDSYLVMRHGANGHECGGDGDMNIPGLKCIPGDQLGCYFCNDVTAPGNSMKGRTFDQQCTVTRPGVSSISAALAVELLVSITQHEKKAAAPAFYQMTNKNEENSIPEGILGIVPHSIRGYLSTFEHILPATERFSQCIACSQKVQNEFEENKIEFLMKVFNSADYLESVTGIDKMAELDNDIIDCDDFSVESD